MHWKRRGRIPKATAVGRMPLGAGARAARRDFTRTSRSLSICLHGGSRGELERRRLRPNNDAIEVSLGPSSIQLVLCSMTYKHQIMSRCDPL